ncbi:BTAD domain-containing putative transcriptional regulator [Streptomyces sp. AGS-58]|uniref:AfsR/SARP family transcriptional regulator n=1 Tax=unclassified Streptomyces TaxID=2593676 RepID=UPI0035A326C0
MRILLLGPVELRTQDGSAVHVGGARRRAVLATLAMEVNRVVPVDRLLDLVWDHAPPPTAKAVLQGHVAGLRALFDDTVRLITKDPGYALEADPNRIDVHLQQRLLTRARSAQDHEAVQLLRQALCQWRGPALADCGSTALREGSARRLESIRLHALEELAERTLRAGEGHLVTADLSEALTVHPLRESLVRLLMLCLRQEGRQAEALAAYHALRTQLSDEAGIDPGPELQAAFAQVLGAAESRGPQAQATVRPVPAATAAASDRTRVRLPRETGGFIGRVGELAWLDGHSGPEADGLLLVTGPAGVGKTALVMRWAHRHATSFPDGRIGVNLRGFDETEPLRPEEAMASLLVAVGVPESEVPEGLEQRAGRYHAELAGQRILIVLENARSAEQVLPLLPTEPGCVVLVTSRNRLSELVALYGAAVLPLSTLSDDEALAVLARMVSRERVEAEPEAAQQVAALCQGLPLALRIAGARLATRQHWSVAELAEELADERSRLTALSTPGTISIEAALELTCRSLPRPAADFFVLLGLHPGEWIDVPAAAALGDMDERSARTALALLDSVHLVHEARPGRYTRHDLVRVYTHQAAERIAADPRQQAVDRLLDHYRALVLAACSAGSGTPPVFSPNPPVAPQSRTASFGSAADALSWFASTEPTIRELIVAGTKLGRHERVCALAEPLGDLYYRYGGRVRGFESAMSVALEAAATAGTTTQWPGLISVHGVALHVLGRLDESLARAQHAAALAERAGSPCFLLLTQNRLANVLVSLGDLEQAARLQRAAVRTAQGLGEHRLAARSLNNLANVLVELGDPEGALIAARESVALLDGRADDPFLISSCQTEAEVLHALGRHAEALARSEEVLGLGRAQGNRRVEGYCEQFIGRVLHEQGRTAEALVRWRRALANAIEHGRPTATLESLIASAGGCPADGLS